MNHVKIAVIRHCSPKTAKTRIYLARQMLWEQLQELRS